MSDEPSTPAPDTAADAAPASTPADRVAPDAVAPDAVAPDAAVTTAAFAARSGSLARAAVVGLRVVAGTVTLAAAGAAVLAVGLLPVPDWAVSAPRVTITPQPADQVRACAGSLLRLGDDSGQDADVADAVGEPEVTGSAGAERSSLDTSGAPTVYTLPAGTEGDIAAVQVERRSDDQLSGIAAASCVEPSGSSWLVGGATVTGRTTLLSLVNPGDVDAVVALTILGENGPVSAPGMSGIEVPAGAQRVFSLAGFAPDLAAPVVHVEARGGRVAATLQQSVVRGLQPGGIEWIGPSSDPSPTVIVPGVRLVQTRGVDRALSFDGWQDADAAVRIAVPGEVDAQVSVVVTPESTVGGTGSTVFELDVPAGTSTDVPLDSGFEAESGGGFPDGRYTVTVESEVPIVAGVRASTADEPSTGATDEFGGAALPDSDLAWFSSADALGDRSVALAGGGPGAVLTAVNAGDQPIEAQLVVGGATTPLTVPAGGAVSTGLRAGEAVLTGGVGLRVAISYAGSGELAARTLAPPRPLAEPITVNP
jgi:hypothetical protein